MVLEQGAKVSELTLGLGLGQTEARHEDDLLCVDELDGQIVGGTPSVNVPLSEDCHIEQIFPNPAVPEHAPDAKPWTVERMDPETVRLNAATSKQPSARIFAIRRA